jgi:hypothetical protein
LRTRRRSVVVGWQRDLDTVTIAGRFNSTRALVMWYNDHLIIRGGGTFMRLSRPRCGAHARCLQRACGWSPDEFAQQLGLARPTLANALGGRYALGQEAMARLDWMLKNPPPTLQASLF